MAHFAELDENNIVLRVIVIDNSELLDEQGNEQEALGIAYCERHFGGRWVQTSYNKKFRKHYANRWYKYDEKLDAFIPQQPFPSWTLNEEFAAWIPPVPEPSQKLEDGKQYTYTWDEANLQWKEHIKVL